MRPALIIFPLVILAACASPREQCIGDVTRDSRVLSSLINETRGNLARGYGLDQRQDVRTRTRSCRGENSDGSTFRYPCTQTETFTTTVPVAIDLNAEEAKLASLEKRFVQAQAASNQAIVQCISNHPE